MAVELTRVLGVANELLSIQDNVERALSDVDSDITRGRLIKDVQFGAGVSSVPVVHELKRSPLGAIVVKSTELDTYMPVFVAADHGTITLHRSSSTNAATVSVWVF